MRLLVTRPEPVAGQWAQALRRAGLEAAALPLLAIGPPADPGAVRRAWQQLPGQALAMFVSANAVQAFFDARPGGAAWPPGVLAASTGPGTSAALREAGVPADALAEPDPAGGRFDSEALWQQLAGRDWQGRAVMIVRGEGGRDWLARTLGERGASVGFVEAYRRLPPLPDAAAAAVLAEALAQPGAHLWHFSSSEAVGRLGELAPAADWSAASALATHPRIAEAARRLGFGRVDEVGVGLPALLARLGAPATPSIESTPP